MRPDAATASRVGIPEARGVDALTMRANAYEVVNAEEHRIRVTDLDFAAYVAHKGRSRQVELVDAYETADRRGGRPLQMALEFYDPTRVIPTLAAAYATSEEAGVLDMVRRLKKVIYRRPSGYDGWRPRGPLPSR